jgi:ATP phosphoribosyltransferase
MKNWIIVVPKNRSLVACKKIVETLVREEGIANISVLECRGKDVPFFVKSLLSLEKNAVGITGEDLFREWELENPKEHLDVIRRYEWKDNSALFGKPVLGLMGPPGKKISDLPKKLRIATSDKYKKISEQYLNSIKDSSHEIDIIPLAGSVEDAFKYGIVDLVIDIVYSGKSSKEAGLEYYETIFESDIVVVGDKTHFNVVPKIAIKK